ncbi:hypothetical protein K438DRAFT_2049994 [Mycena galopus ATCC 62051]|nr:hypothetical protein K438DRAFT_2049994 [Mycena galopus ATCC 62051]
MWALSLMKHDDLSPFHDYKSLYETINATAVGDMPWKCFQTEPLNPAADAPAWARQQYEVWYCDPDVVIANMLDNPDLNGGFDTTPYVHLDANGKRHWSDFMSANFAWRHCVSRRTHGLTDELLAAFAPNVLWDSYGIDVDIIPFTRDFPRTAIREMLSLDLLHQVIKGSFKDHLVTWVGEYLYIAHSNAEADSIMDEIDRRIAATPAFPCLRRFKQGRRFKQWTGDDSKALMKVYLAAIKGLVPDEIVQAIGAFLDFCYIVRRDDFYEATLDSVDQAVRNLHTHREIFRVLGVRADTPGGSRAFSLPPQYSITHYRHGIEDRYEALSQMLQTNQRLDKLAAARADFVERGMLPPTYVPPVIDPEDDDGGPVDTVRVEGNVVLARTRVRGYPRYSAELAQHIRLPTFPTLLASFLEDQLYSDNYSSDGNDVDAFELATTPISVFHSAIATFYAPSDRSGIPGMRRERIRSTPSWRKHGPRRDCAFAVEDQQKPGFRGMSVVHIKLFFSFVHDGVEYPCALVEWFKKVGRSPDISTGMWIVEPEYRGKNHLVTILHLDSLMRGAHLVPVFGSDHIPVGFSYRHSLDAFKAFHVNKYIDYHANEIAF